MIFKIAKTDLRNLFYSPVAWFLTIAFWVQTAYFYFDGLLPKAKWQDIALRNSPDFDGYGMSFTRVLFLNNGGVFDNVLKNLYLFVPLLTMDLISREINNGTIRLLYSSPIRTLDIVLGKYVAVMVYNLLLVGIVAVFMLSGCFSIQSADYGLLLSGALGFYLLVCAYTAIGLFMSSLTTYPIVSAIGSFIIVLVLARIGTLWQQYDFVRDLTYFLSISGRTTKMLVGLITSKDVIYFLLVIYLFIGFTWIRLQGAREYKTRLVRLGRYAFVIVTALGIGYASSRPGMIAYWDTTANQSNTISDASQKIIGSMKNEKLDVTLYTNLFAEGAALGFPEKRNDYLARLWEPYLRFKPDINFNYIYYYDLAKSDSMLYHRFPGKDIHAIAAEMASGFEQPLSRFKKPEEARKVASLSAEGYAIVMQLSYKGKTTFLRTFIDNLFWPDETQVGAALKRLLQPQMPKVYYLTGNLERSIEKFGAREYSIHSSEKKSRGALVNNGFDVDTLNLDTADFPADAEIVVLADPKTALSEVSSGRLAQYIGRGGNLLVTGEPGKQKEINAVLKPMGIELADGMLAQPSKNYAPDLVTSFFTPTAATLADQADLIHLREEWDTVRMPLTSATAITLSDSTLFKVKPLLLTEDGKAWLKKGKFVTDSVPPVFNPVQGDVKQANFTTAMALTRQVGGKEQRIAVFGDADFMNNMQVTSHSGIVQAFFSWLNNNIFPIYPRYAPVADTRLSISYSVALIQKVGFLWVIPGLLLLGGTILLIRRRRQ